MTNLVNPILPLAITKTSPGHGTYCLRLYLHDGAIMHYTSARELNYDELIAALEQRIADIRKEQAAEAKPPVSPEGTEPGK